MRRHVLLTFDMRAEQRSRITLNHVPTRELRRPAIRSCPGTFPETAFRLGPPARCHSSRVAPTYLSQKEDNYPQYPLDYIRNK